jgi:hypothetical protein
LKKKESALEAEKEKLKGKIREWHF